jgi:branched-chain amino acid transport system permease protein
MATITNFFYLTLIVIGAGTLFCWYFTHTAMGKTVLLMRENEGRMKMLGYNTNISRLILFIFTGAVAGLAGSFYTLHFRFVSLSAIDPMDVGASVLLITFVGGMKTFWGPIVGAFVYIMLQNYLSTITDRWPLFIGLIFVLMVLFIPGGLSEVIMNIYQRFFGRKDRNDGGSAAAEEAKS